MWRAGARRGRCSMNPASAARQYDTVYRWEMDRLVRESMLDLNRFLELHTTEIQRLSNVIPRVVLGDAAVKIVDVACEQRSDLIVMSPLRRFPAVLYGQRYRQGDPQSPMSRHFNLRRGSFAAAAWKTDSARRTSTAGFGSMTHDWK